MKPRRLTLALAGLGLWAGLAQAQQPAGPMYVQLPGGQVVQVVTPVTMPDTIPPPEIIEADFPVDGPPAGIATAKGWTGLPHAANPAPGGIPNQVGQPAYAPPQYPPVQTQYGPRPMRNALNFLGVCCWSHHTSHMSCGSLCSELRFVFGSCRAFFAEPCEHGPPGHGVPGPQPRPVTE